MREVSADDVIKFLGRMEYLDIKVWIVGGWGVDALLGTQSRAHDDLDIVIQRKDTAVACRVLEENGFTNIPRPDTSAWNFVMGDNLGREIDFHVVMFDENGDGLYGAPGKEVVFPPAGSLYDEGEIARHKVSCLTPEFTVKDHTGYKLREKDYHDVGLLCRKFNLAIPEEYRDNNELSG